MTSGTIIKTTTISIETTNTSKSVVDTSTGYSIRTTNSTVDANNAGMYVIALYIRTYVIC